MNRSQLIDKIALDVGCTKTAAELLVKSFVKTITEAKEPVSIQGFGTFERRARKAREMMINNKMTHIPACTQLTFKASKTLKQV